MSETSDLHQDPESLVHRYLENPRSDLKDLIIVQYAPMVERIARRFTGLEPLEDLVQVGFVGLLNALTKFDRDAGVRFNTYATYLVAGEIKHYLRDRTQTIRHPAWLQELRHRVQRAQNMLQQEHARVPTEREIAENLGISEAAVREVFQTQEMLKVASLDSAGQNDEDGDSEVEKLDAAAFCPEQLSLEDRIVLEHAMKQLRDLEREVLVLFHFDSMNQTEIANKLGISCNYVSHILRQSLAKLRKILMSENEKDRVLRRQAAEIDYEVIEPSTGAYTEGFFRARLEEEIHRASCDENPLGVVVINFRGLDTLKAFYGEQSVLDFLADAAEFFRDNLRRLDLVCRWGVTGFGIILPSTGHNVTVVRNRLVDKISEWMSVRYAANSPVRVEIGHGVFPENGKTSKELFDYAALKPLEPGESRAA
jgi:RNA polymerase sigma-B factor